MQLKGNIMSQYQMLIIMIDGFLQIKNEAHKQNQKLTWLVFFCFLNIVTIIAVGSILMLVLDPVLKTIIISVAQVLLLISLLYIAKKVNTCLSFLNLYKKELYSYFVQIHEFEKFCDEKKTWNDLQKDVMKKKLQLADPNL